MARETKDTIIDNVIVALDALTYDQLLVVAEKATKLADGKKAEAKQALISEFLARAEGLGLSLVEKTGRGRGPGRKAAAASPGPKVVKFRDAQGNTWSGAGPRPKWLKEAVDAGKSIDEFRV